MACVTCGFCIRKGSRTTKGPNSSKLYPYRIKSGLNFVILGNAQANAGPEKSQKVRPKSGLNLFPQVHASSRHTICKQYVAFSYISEATSPTKSWIFKCRYYALVCAFLIPLPQSNAGFRRHQRKSITSPYTGRSSTQGILPENKNPSNQVAGNGCNVGRKAATHSLGERRTRACPSNLRSRVREENREKPVRNPAESNHRS